MYKVSPVVPLETRKDSQRVQDAGQCGTIGQGRDYNPDVWWVCCRPKDHKGNCDE